ncbi:MAG: ECF transporter S component [Candidatus Bathyarchaeia archaeon]
MVKVSVREVSALAINAALYAVGSYATAYIQTPWLVQLRPAVVIPAVFAVLFGPIVGGLGAALGTFIASILTYGSPVLTIFSGTPGNFVCFYIIGKISKPLNWRNFVAATLMGFLAGSIIIGFGLWLLLAKLSFLIPTGTYAYKAVEGAISSIAKDPATWILNTIVWTLGTGVICTVFIGTPILRACEKAFPNLLTNQEK